MSSEGSSSSNPKSLNSCTIEYIHDVFFYVSSYSDVESFAWICSLKASLNGNGIKMLFDTDYNVDISPPLLSAIQRSRLFLLLFTPAFFHSENCLGKLEKIMECHENMGNTLLPIFCKVSPDQIRQWWIRKITPRTRRSILSTEILTRPLVKAMRRVSSDGVDLSKYRRIEGLMKTEDPSAGCILVSSWECNLSSESGNQKIREITNFIKREIEISRLLLPPHLVGIQLCVKDVLNLCNYYSKDISLPEENVIIVGIWGIGGIGKTTIATAIYDTIKGNFERRSFLENIKNVWMKDNGPTCLQEQLISNISLTKSEEIHDIELGTRQIMTVLHNKRSLVVLDDVSQMDQLMAFSASGKGFGSGSMILITTRDKHLLEELEVKYVYEMRRMGETESLELFSWRAFKQSSPSDNLAKIAERVVDCCEGLPLVLQVIGSLLCNRKITEWQRVLKKLKSIPTGEILEKLKISYEYLDYSLKDILFNIACCYVGEGKEYVTEKLSGSRLPIETGISMLIERSLVEVNENNKLRMHDLLQDIAKGINHNKPKPKYVYDVFLSFRGVDTRRSFTAHLYDALKRAGIEVFMDNGIHMGKNLSSSLTQAIESSRMSIIIFSSNYGGSRWCLEELEKIMECHRTNGQEVLPIFYDVEPSDVRKQAGTFGKALERLKMRIKIGKDKELSWTRALNEAANLSGWNSYGYRTEVELIDHVIETISIKLDDSKCFLVANHPVGVKSRMQEIITLLSGKSNEIILVGIFGMGGIGKTTIAKAIYNEIGQNFEGKSFLNNIREIWEQDNGQVCLQEQLLSSILKTKRMTLHSVEFGRIMLKDRLRHKRVFVVLDDVNNVDQLNALCGISREWFGPGSRIIITTRDEHLLKILQVDNVYNMKEMDDDESLELFSWHAFKRAVPAEDFVELSQRIIAYSEGLPLALEILGSYLYDRTVQAWKSVLGKLQEIPNDQIHKKLKISFDGLSDDMEKDIFLDICCFFIGKDRNYVEQILCGCGLHADIGITRLIERSLVKVDKKNKLEMHNLIRDMGREIIREESPKKPEKRSRLWFYNDVINVLKNNIGTISVKGLALNLPRVNTPCFNTIAFCMMKRVTLLQLGHVKLDGRYEYLSKELRWLCWHGFPSNYMPDNFIQENVVAIDLKYSNLIQIWKKGQLMEHLKILNLSHSYYLTSTPDFSKLPKLEKLVLKDCPRLSSVHQSIGDLKHLILVNLKDCKDLSHLPRSLYKLKSLKTLNISGCSNLDKLEENIVQMDSLTTLLANGTAITKMPLSLVRSRSIKYVSLCGHEGLPSEVFPPLIWSRMSPTHIPRSLIQPFASMPFLLPWLWHSLYDHRRAKFETKIKRDGGSTSQFPCAKSPALIGFHDQVHFTRVENFMGSLTIQVGEFNHVTDTLLKNISQRWSERGMGCSLPRNNNPDWLVFESEGSSLSFKVPEVTSCCLKGMIFCIIYSFPQDSMPSIYPVGVTIRNFSKTTIDFYKRDAATSDDKEWQNIIPNLEPRNEVEVTVAFAHRHTVNKTAIYLVYGEVDNKSR